MVRPCSLARTRRPTSAVLLLAAVCFAGQVDSLRVFDESALRRVRRFTVCDLDTAGAKGDVEGRAPYVRLFTELMVNGISSLAGIRAARYGTGGEAPEALIGGRFIELEGGGGRTQCRVELTIVDATSLQAILVARHSRLTMGAEDDGLRKDVTATVRDILGALYQYLGQPSPGDSTAFRCSMISGRILHYATPLHVGEERVNATIARVEMQKRFAGCGCRAQPLPFALDTALLHRYQSTALQEYDAERLMADAAEVLAGTGVEYLLLLHSFTSATPSPEPSPKFRPKFVYVPAPAGPAGAHFSAGTSIPVGDPLGTPNKYSQLACGALLVRVPTRTLLASRTCWVDEDEASEDAVDRLLDCVFELPCEVNQRGKCVRCGQW